ncbi:DUF2529 family protein [Staphylococcus felis]|uniref:DUF2529 domain-containing protein n=1 Tax=Staphylococcus felis TaxID=46127 RepID=A0A2K3ZJV3_9STAP|nr:DUF2529 family protein [Staphylococcus felis]AVP35497.1 DUF2529 domain-containing protein [Staphylococcus felis]MBH9581339.1 DUF2529 domain-containing protein [Staphylococcus felis]MDM8327727.1 DUF2529 family protein [Staphylococcus felis]MDQ7193393.1 DUF2529 family protein [Staphylococcus felis]PNZ38152.1 DUF2529 domain-containing protein [Staphylococcus felis]
MSKMLTTQLTGVFHRLESQSLDIQMAAQSLIQAIGGEGHIYVKGYGDLKHFENYIVESSERLKSSQTLDSLHSFDQLDSTDRILLFSPYFDEAIQQDLTQLLNDDRDVVVITNKSKDTTLPDHLVHFVDLSTPRPIVYTEDFDKVVTPHIISMGYIYYEIYTQMVEMITDLEL